MDSEFRVGRTSVVKVHELDLNDFTAAQLLPDFDPDVLTEHPDWADPKTYNAETGRVFLSVHTWVVRHEDKVILIDTGAGKGKSRPTMPVLDHLHQPYLERLAAVGVRTEDVDYVLLTHIHADHVGWNTRWDGQHWVPTFPNATVICSGLEWRYGAALDAGDEEAVAAARAEAGLGQPLRTPVPGVFSDSIAPIAAAGRLKLVKADGDEVLEGICFLPTPGHSIDHAAISIVSQGRQAVFGGDTVHHPFELYDMDLVSMFCEFPEAARVSRRRLTQHVSETGALYFSSHFPATSVGKITRVGGGLGWDFLETEVRRTRT